MNKNLYSGKLIAVDGPNGAGKTTIIQELKKELEKRGIEACFTKEPTDNELGCFVREYAERFDGISVACLVAADRYQHLRDEIVPQLEKGKIVITDRYVLSSLILQRMDEVSEEFILALNNEIVQPDLQIAVFADRDVIQNRLKERSCLTRFERGNKTNKELEYMEKGIQVLQEQGIDVFQLINDNNFMYGFPDETQEDMEETYKLACELRNISEKCEGTFRPSVFQFRPYHGTRLYNEILEKGIDIPNCHYNSSYTLKGRSQFNFCSGNYSRVPDEILEEYIVKTQKIMEA